MAVAALAVLLYHGLLDSELYASWLAPLLFLPFAFVLGAARLDQYVIDDLPFGKYKRDCNRRVVSGGIIGLAAVAVALLLALIPPVQAAFLANLGAVAQSQIELSVYSWPQWAVQDELRRTDTLSLEPAIARYQAALALYPGNVTALRRLGQIALSQGNYDAARSYLERAYAFAPQPRIIHRLLGEALTVNGDVERGVAMWNEAAIDTDWINQRRWWYIHIGATHQAAWLMDAIAAKGRQEEVSQ